MSDGERRPNRVDEVPEDFFSTVTQAPQDFDTFRLTPDLKTESPRVIGGYELIRVLGQGGMGTVYLARQTRLGRLVAFKTMRLGSIESSQTEVERFRFEAEAIARLEHPNIASLYEIGEADGTMYLAMQFIDGETLDVWKKRISPSLDTCVTIVRDIALAVAHAHRNGVVHRDLKPKNIMIDQSGKPYVVDFGLAKGLYSENEFTETGLPLGTPAYMAPEQAIDAKKATSVADVYAMGAILFYLLTERPPFTGLTLFDTLHNVVNLPVPSVRSINLRVSRDLDTLCAKCMEKNPALRYSTAEALVDDLNRYLQRLPIKARKLDPATRTWRWCLRNRLASTFMLVMATMLVGMSGLYWKANTAVREAQSSFRRQVVTINELLVQIGSADLKNIPNSQEIRQNLLRKAQQFFHEAKNSSTYFDASDEEALIFASLQLAGVTSELASTQQEKELAYKQLRIAERELLKFIDDPRHRQASPQSVIEVYCVTDSMREWWGEVQSKMNLQNEMESQKLVRYIRTSVVSDNLVNQLKLIRNQPDLLIETAERVVSIRTDLRDALPADPQSQRRLAGAKHNLAEAYRIRGEQTQSIKDFELAADNLRQAQELLEPLVVSYPSESVQMELAKARFSLATTLYGSMAYASSGEPNRTSMASLAAQIRLAFTNVIEGVSLLENSSSFGTEARELKSFSLRELCMFDMPLEKPDDQELDQRHDRLVESCRILEELSRENPRITRFTSQWLKSLAAFYNVCGQQTSSNQIDKRFADDISKHLKNAESLARAAPESYLLAYLELNREAARCMSIHGSTSDALQMCQTARDLAEDLKVSVTDLRLHEELEYLDLVLAEAAGAK